MKAYIVERKRIEALVVCVALLCTVLGFHNTEDRHLPAFWGRPATVNGATATVTIEDEPVPLAGGTLVLTPTSPGTTTFSGGGATVDASNAAEGYVTVACRSSARIKVQITKSGGVTYTYNLNGNGNYEVFPLTGGDGVYKVAVYQNVSGNQYAEAVSVNLSVTLRGQALPYLYPNQYVNFNQNSKTVAKGQELAQGAPDDLTIVSNVFHYVTQNITYDTAKAQAVQTQKDYLPVVDDILASGKGICFDYAAVMATMLRSQQIPTRLEVGYVSNGAYHAWISTYISDMGWVNGVIYFDGQSWKLMDPTFYSSGGGSESIVQYIGNGSNYRTQYVY